MEMHFRKNSIELEKELNMLDRLAIDFSSEMERLGVKNAIVSGYVSILFGRNRGSEDIDMLTESMDFQKFMSLWKGLEKKFECLNTSNPETAFNDYINARIPLRFSKRGEFVPNMEIKTAKNRLESWVIENRKTVVLNGRQIHVSPIEVQIAFKLFLGSEKDIEDARYLYSIFRERINESVLGKFLKKLRVESYFRRYLK